MAKSTALNFTQETNNKGTSFVNADGTSFKTVFTAGADGSVIRGINISSTDTAARNIQFVLNDGTNDFQLVTVNVPITAGTTGSIASVDALSTLIPSLPVDNNGRRTFGLKSGWIIKAKALVAVTAATTVDVLVFGEDM